MARALIKLAFLFALLAVATCAENDCHIIECNRIFECDLKSDDPNGCCKTKIPECPICSPPDENVDVDHCHPLQKPFKECHKIVKCDLKSEDPDSCCKKKIPECPFCHPPDVNVDFDHCHPPQNPKLSPY